MPVVDVVNLDGKKVGEVELADAVFGAKVNPHLLHEASRWYLKARFTDRGHAVTAMQCPRKCCLAHCVRRCRRSWLTKS